KREMRLRLGKVTVADVLAAQPVTTNLLKFMRASIKMIGVSNLQSFIASMTQKLTLSDISDESKNLVPTTLPTAYDVYPLDGRHDGGYYTVKDCVTIDVLPRTPGNNVYVGFMVWSNFTATKCRGLVS